MLNFPKLAIKAEKLVIDNSPLILTVVGATGSIASTVLGVKATFKAAKKISDAEFVIHTTDSKTAALTKADKVKMVWTLYIAPAAVLGVSVGAIVMSNRISVKRAAALAAGYTLVNDRFDEYRAKVEEKLGLKKEQELRTEIAQKDVENNPPSTTLIVAEGKVLFRDEPSGRYFESTMETIKSAQNAVNYRIMNREYAVLSDLYEELGLAPTSLSEEFGWDLKNSPVEIEYTPVLTPDNKPCIRMDYNVYPVRNGAPSMDGMKIRAVNG